MNNNMIIILLLVLYTVYKRLNISDIIIIGDTLITKQNNLLVHPNGPLNPLIGYITHKNGYMHNKRFYTP
ncbi:hypothetical protein NEIRO03_2759, partial [Nematocida sp. AWRm78]